MFPHQRPVSRARAPSELRGSLTGPTGHWWWAAQLVEPQPQSGPQPAESPVPQEQVLLWVASSAVLSAALSAGLAQPHEQALLAPAGRPVTSVVVSVVVNVFSPPLR